MKRTLTFTLSAVLALAPAVPASAQADAAHPVRSSVEAVAADVEVLVLDSKGKPVEGLGKGDFRLFVNGKETPVDWLEAPPAPAGTAPAAPAATEAAPAAPPPTAAVAARRMHSTVFVISDLHTDVRARNDGIKALRAYVDRMPPGEEAAVYLLDNGVRRLQAFTSDRSTLKKALEKPAKTLPRSYVFPQKGSVEWEGQSRQMLRNFTTVLQTVANRPEPKTVVVLAGPISPTGFVQPIGGPAGSGATGQTVFTTGAPADSPVPQVDVLSTNGKLLLGARPLELPRRGEGRRVAGPARPRDDRRPRPDGTRLPGREGRDQLAREPERTDRPRHGLRAAPGGRVVRERLGRHLGVPERHLLADGGGDGRRAPRLLEQAGRVPGRGDEPPREALPPRLHAARRDVLAARDPRRGGTTRARRAHRLRPALPHARDGGARALRGAAPLGRRAEGRLPDRARDEGPP